MTNRIFGAVIAFFFGILLMPLTPIILAAVIFNEFEEWEER